MSLKSNMVWLLKGRSRTEAALQQLGNDLRDLQHKVDELAASLTKLDAQVAVGAGRAEMDRLEQSVDAMREQLRNVTDDLGDRVGAVSQLLNSQR